MKARKPMRALLDTNILVSYLLAPERGSAITRVVEAGVGGEFQMLVPEELLGEMIETVRRHDHLARRIPPDILRRFAESLLPVAEIILRISEPIPAVTRDPKDDYLLAYALVGQADYLVTGDRDLLVLGQVENTQVVSAADFAKVLEAKGFSS